jgi:MFS family permease
VESQSGPVKQLNELEFRNGAVLANIWTTNNIVEIDPASGRVLAFIDLTGLAPTFTSFLVLRALFGIGMGGQWGVGASLVMEKVPPRLRGVFSGLLQQGYAAGYLLAALCFFVVFPRWGWRRW